MKLLTREDGYELTRRQDNRHDSFIVAEEKAAETDYKATDKDVS